MPSVPTAGIPLTPRSPEPSNPWPVTYTSTVNPGGSPRSARAGVTRRSSARRPSHAVMRSSWTATRRRGPAGAHADDPTTRAEYTPINQLTRGVRWGARGGPVGRGRTMVAIPSTGPAVAGAASPAGTRAFANRRDGAGGGAYGRLGRTG